MFQGTISLALARRVLAAVIVLAGLILACRYPLGAGWALAGFFAAAALLYASNDLWVGLLPVVLVVADLYPLTGNLLIVESDWFLLILSAVLLWRGRSPSLPVTNRNRPWILWLPLLVSVTISFTRGWHRLPASYPGDELTIYSSCWSAVRVAKGFAWGFILAWLFSSRLAQKPDAFSIFKGGMQASAFLVAIFVMLERATSVGLLDRDQLFRATGPFVSMHTGGLLIDAFLAIALPFIFLPIFRRAWLDFMARAVLLVIAYYAIAATMSRGIIILSVFSTLAMIVLLLFVHGKGPRRLQTFVFAIAAILLVASAITIATKNTAITDRFTKTGRDLELRLEEWQAVRNAGDQSWPAKLLGNGLGTVPRMTSIAYDQPYRSSELVDAGEGGVALRIHPGKEVYTEQLVDIGAPGPWTLHGRLRADGRIDVHGYICQKSLLDSFRCAESSSSSYGKTSDWQPFTWTFDTTPLTPPNSPWRRLSVSLAFSASNEGTSIDVANLQLKDANGNSLLLNSDFKAGSSHWFFTSDDHRAWRVENLWIQLYLEQGFFGVLALAWLVIGTLWLLARRVAESRDYASCVLGVALVGFLSLAVFGSMLETPWITELFCVLLAVSQSRSRSIGQ